MAEISDATNSQLRGRGDFAEISVLLGWRMMALDKKIAFVVVLIEI